MDHRLLALSLVFDESFWFGWLKPARYSRLLRFCDVFYYVVQQSLPNPFGRVYLPCQRPPFWPCRLLLGPVESRTMSPMYLVLV